MIIVLSFHDERPDGEELTGHFGYSFYFAFAAAVFHIVIGIAGGMQKTKSGYIRCTSEDIGIA